jgi:predicted PurR-regulated permease PerM
MSTNTNTNKKTEFSWLGLVIILALVTGYILNIIKLIGTDFALALSWGIARILGVVIPFIGAVLGFF